MAAEPLTAGIESGTVYAAAWRAILEESGLDYRLVDIPDNIRRDMFVRGDLALDCCAAPDWRRRPDEQAVQIFSNHFFYANDVAIVHEDSGIRIDKLSELSDYRMAVVRNYSYSGDEYFQRVVQVETLDMALAVIARGEAEVTIINEQSFQSRRLEAPLPLAIAGKHSPVTIHARVHKDHGDALKAIDAAIARLKANGDIERVIGAAIRNRGTRAATNPPRRSALNRRR